MGPKKKSSKRGGKKPVFRPQPKGQGSSGRIAPLLEEATEQMNAGKYGRASAALKKILAIEEDHPEALRIFATLHLKLGSLMAAKTSFESLAKKAMKNKDYRLAESLLREYLTVAPRYVPFLELLGKALEANGHFMAAVAEYGKAIEILVEEDDSDLPTKGAELYEAMKAIGAESNLTKKLSVHFEDATSPKEESSLQDEILLHQAQWEGGKTDQAPSTPLAFSPRDEGAPAPFPWTPTDEPDSSSLAGDEAILESSSEPSQQEPEIETLLEDASQEMEAGSVESTQDSEPLESSQQIEVEENEFKTSHSESLSEAEPLDMSTGPFDFEFEDLSTEKTDVLADHSPEKVPEGTTEATLSEEHTVLQEQTIDPLPWEEIGVGRTGDGEAASCSRDVTDELAGRDPISQGEPVEEMPTGVEDQTVSPTKEHADASSVQDTPEPAPWEMPSSSSDASIAPLPWEDNFESPSQALEASEALDTQAQETSDSIVSDDISKDPESTNSGLSFNPVEKDSSSFAPFPWESQDDSPAPVISDSSLSSDIEATDSTELEELQASEDNSILDVGSSQSSVDSEPHDPVAEFLSDDAAAMGIDLQLPPATDSLEPSPPDSNNLDSPVEELPILEESSETISGSLDTLPPSTFHADSSESPDSGSDISHEPMEDLPDSETDALEEKPIEQAAAEAMAALQSDPQSSPEINTGGLTGSSFAQSGTLELKELPEESGTKEEEEVLAQAAADALTSFESEIDRPDSSQEEPQILSEFPQEVNETNEAIDVPLDIRTSDEPLSEEVETESLRLDDASSQTFSESGSEPSPLAEEEMTVGSFALAEDADVSLQEDIPVQIDHEEETVAPEPVAEETPVALSPWDSQEDTVEEPSYSDIRFEEKAEIEEPVQESSGIPSTIQFAQSEEPTQSDEVEATVSYLGADTQGEVSRTDVGIDVVYPDSESPTYQEELTEEPVLKEGSRKVRASGPAWAVAQSQEGLADKAESKKPLFPTANKLGVKARIFTNTVISAVRTVSILSIIASLGVGILGLVAVGIISLIWIAVEERPNEPFHNMMKSPTLSRLDSNRNGYNVLRQLGVSSNLYPISVQARDKSEKATADLPGGSFGNSDIFTTIAGWYQLSDPITEFQTQSSQLRAWSSQFSSDLSKYHQWSGRAFEDIGYRVLEGPDEKHILSVHQLFIAEGFSGTIKRGVDRLANDMEAWRYALGQAKTLRIKMLAIEIVKDDLVVLSALLGDPHLDRNHLPVLTQLGRPISQAERSLRWPMQNQFALEVDQIKTHLNSRNFPERPFYKKVMTYLPLPQQKVFNAHAVFYENLVKHDAALHLEGDPRKGMPERYPLAHSPAESLGDYFNNPVDNLVMTDLKVDWREIAGRLIELEARMRLTSLQARIRRPPETRDPISRIASAGQDYFDPFTGYTMLLNASKTRIYSVGSDGVDDDGNLERDVVVPLFQR